MRRIIACLLSVVCALAAAEGAVYAEVLRGMGDHPNRQPGSPGWRAAAEAVEGALRGAGLDPKRLEYPTMVPRTQICRLVVDGVEIPGALALAPNGPMPPTTWGGEIEGPALWLGDGTLAEMAGLPVEGSIAFLRLGSRNLPQVFAMGARAVVAVGAEATQWQAARMFSEAPIASPRAWLPREAAEAAGLTANGAAPRRASLRLDVRWADTEAADVWAFIPAAEGAPADRAGQTLVLAAELATTGVVPEQSPGRRQAANVALLAELAARLQQQRPERNVLIAFLGSHYAGQDGARVLYWVAHKAARGAREADRIELRVDWTRDQAAVCATRIELLAQPDVLARSGDDAFWLRERLRRMVTADVNALNYDFRYLNLARKAAEDGGDTVLVAQKDASIKELKDRIHRLNEMRRQLHERQVTDPELYGLLAGRVTAELTSLRTWLLADQGRMTGARELEQVLTGRPVIAHAGIDFADAARPWYANPFGLDCMVVLDGGRGPQPGHVVKHIDAWQQAWDRIADGHQGQAPLRNPELATNYSYEFLSHPRRRQVAAVVPLSMGMMGAQLTTLGDPLDADEMPAVTTTPDLLPLAEPVSAWVRSLLSVDLPLRTGLPQVSRFDDKLVYRWTGSTWGGLRVDQLSPGSEEVEGPAAGAMIFIARPELAPSITDGALVAGRSNAPMARVNPAGYLFAPMVVDDNTTQRIHGLAFDAQTGAPQSYHDGKTASGTMAFNIRLFTGHGNAFYTPFLPAEYSTAGAYQRLMGRMDSSVKRNFGGHGTGGAVVVTNEERSLKLIGNSLFVLNSSPARPQGEGIVPLPQALLGLDLVRQSAIDVSLLNRQRLQVLRDKNLVNRPIERVHADCLDHIESAAQARGDGDLRRAAAHETVAAVLAGRAHAPLRDNANDLLSAVVVLLVLSIPFAFALERLVLGAVSIYRQIMGFSAIFLTTFGVLYYTHPAFSLADAPIIIFLAFIIILLSAFVISVVMGKFKQELKAIQGLSQRAHSSGGGGSTTFAAIVIGIAGMRNRPLKTFLTATTVTLLTFTILVFASFQSGSGVVENYLGRSRGVDRIEVHQPSFLRIPERLVESIETIHGDRFEVLRRTASFRDPLAPTEYERTITNVLLDPAGGRSVQLSALLGLDPRELPRLPQQGFVAHLDHPDAGQHPPLWLSETVAARLRLEPGAEVRLRGRAFAYAGTFTEDALRGVENIDGTRLMPPDFAATFAAAGQQNVGTGNFNEAVQNLDATSFIFASPTLTAITTNAAVQELGGMVNVVMLYPSAEVDLGRAAGEIAGFFRGPIYATSGDGAKRYFYTREITGSGYLDLVVPLLLGGLIIFSSLLGSIVDRQKEIFTYSALGLSPRDVGTLFFAESSVIAVVGGMGGYLIGQVAAKLLHLLGDRGLVNVPDMNFASLSSLVTILIVMAMVLLSTIYPALMASRSANPGVNRSWKMPKPEGDRLSFTFPFTVPEKSFGGIVAYIREHFGNHSDAALDVFAAKQVSLFKVDDHRIGIRAEVALAPFDLGVYQRFAMRTRASDIPGIDEVVVEIERVNGHVSTWLRGNHSFIKDLREQFLIWRSLPPEAVEHYQAEAVLAVAEADAGNGGADGQA